MAINSFKNDNKENIVCLNFNSWLFEDYEDAKVSLIGLVLDEIRGNLDTKEKATITNKINKNEKRVYKNIDGVNAIIKG